MNDRRYIDVTDTAKLIRKALKSCFPDTKFSVRSSRYSGGASIDVRWTDGPAEPDVKRVVERYEGATFDGMIDLKSHHDSVLAHEDGSVERVHFGADFVFTNRDKSPEAVRDAIGRLRGKWGADAIPEGLEDAERREWANHYVEPRGEYLAALVHRDLYERDLRAQEVPA